MDYTSHQNYSGQVGAGYQGQQSESVCPHCHKCRHCGQVSPLQNYGSQALLNSDAANLPNLGYSINEEPDYSNDIPF